MSKHLQPRFPFPGFGALALALAVLAGAAAAIDLGQAEEDRARMDGLRARLSVDAPGTRHPTVTILSPSRTGGIAGSTHTTQHDERGRLAAAPEARLAWVALDGGRAARGGAGYPPLASLVRVDRASELVDAGSAGEIRVVLGNGTSGQAAIDNVAAAAETLRAEILAESMTSDHEHLFDSRDWLVFDVLHQVVDVRLCDDVSGPLTTCYDAFVQLSRRPDPANRYQMKIGCLGVPCGEALLNLDVSYGGDGRLASSKTEFLIGDERFNLTKELVVSFKEPVAPGELWTRSSGDLTVDDAGNLRSSQLSFLTLYQDAHPSQLDPDADGDQP